jgi:acetylornithine deacetylase
VVVETGAGHGSSFEDAMYEAVGGTIVSTEEAWTAELVLKVKEPLPTEYGFLREGQVLFTYLHLAASGELTRALVDIDSTTGREGEAGRWLADYLRARELAVMEQRVDTSRFNVIATIGEPSVVLSTHFDCVPPFFPSRRDGGRLYGRGACDAKGILAAQVAAVDRLKRDGETRVGLVFVVGEERGSDGAKKANEIANRCRYLIDGEPTDSRLGVATRGILRLKLRADGRAAHSSFPQLGESAIDKLIDALVDLRSITLPSDPVLGQTHYSVGLISGGVAPNVISPAAEAEVMFRTVSEASLVERAVSALAPRVSVEYVLDVPPIRMKTIPGFQSAVFPFTTDIPFLAAWGEPLLFGPGSIHAAHTADEFIEIAELEAAVDRYVALAQSLLESIDRSA